MSEFEVKVLATLERIAIAMERQATAFEKTVQLRAGPGAGPELTDEDLDADLIKNDPLIKKDPPRWSGPKFIGRKMSAATADYLKELANFCEWRAAANEDDARIETVATKKADLMKWARFARLDARRARAWARRKEAGWQPATPTWGDTPPKPAATQSNNWGAPAPAQQKKADPGYPADWDEDDDDEVPLPQ